MYICMCVLCICGFVCMYVCVCICVCMYVCLYVYVYVWVYFSMCVCVIVCMCYVYVCMYVLCTYVCMCVCMYVCVCFLYILLSMLHHPEVTLHTIMCLAIRTCLWVGYAGSACALGVRHCIPFTVFILRLVFLALLVYTFTTIVCHSLLSLWIS